MRMNKTKQLQMISIFIASLVIFIPMSISDAYAATLSVNKVAGTDGVNGFVRRVDTLTVEVAASTGETEDVQPDNLRLFVDDSTAYTFFDNCSRVGTGFSFNCYLVRDYFGWSGTHLIKIDLHTAQTKYDEFAAPAASETVQVSVDIGEPTVENISITPKRSTSNRANISIIARDFGIDDGNPEGCSGIERVEFYLGNYFGELVRTRFPSGDLCVFEDSFIYEAAAEEGEVVVCAKAFDKLGQSRIETRCASFFIDNTAPMPSINSISIVDSITRIPLTYVGGDPISADVTIIIPDDDLVVGSVTADLSALAGSRFAEAPPSQHTYSATDGHVFTWNNVPVESPTACLVAVTAEDEIGNSATTDVPCDVIVDTIGPEVYSITTPFSKEGVYYLGKETVLTATITELGVGLEEGDMRLDLTNINQQSRVKPDDCIQIQSDTWECYWTIQPTVADGQYSVTMLKESKDDLNNIMEERYVQTIGVDKTSPSINQVVNLAIIPSLVEVPYTDQIFTGDNLEFVLQVDDVYSAIADFSMFGGSNATSPDGCWQDENGTTFCKWSVQIQSSGPYDANVQFDFTDFAGNQNTISKKVFVSGLINTTNPDYWDHTVTCSPALIDRELASLLSMNEFCHIKLKPKGNPESEISTFSMEEYPVDCILIDDSLSAGENETSALITDYIGNIGLMNYNPGSRDPYMGITLNTVEFNIDYLTFQCSFKIFTEIQDQYTLYPEIENVSVTLNFYNLPFGTPDEELDNEIEDVKDSLEWLDGWFDELMMVFDYAERLCQVYGMITNLAEALTIIASSIGIGSKAYPPMETAWKAACSGEAVFKEGAFKLGKYMDPLCAFVNCKWTDDALKDSWKTYAGGSGLGDTEWMQSFTSQGFNPKESIVWSIATLCVPGILYNIRKWEEIQCEYGHCLLTYVPAGYPVSVCQNNKAYMECKLLIGQIFGAIPWVAIYQGAMAKIQQNLADPLSAIFWIVSLVTGCNKRCTGTYTGDWQYCAVLGTISMIGQVVEDIENIKEQGWFDQVGNNSCTKWDEALDEYE